MDYQYVAGEIPTAIRGSGPSASAIAFATFAGGLISAPSTHRSLTPEQKRRPSQGWRSTALGLGAAAAGAPWRSTCPSRPASYITTATRWSNAT
jgi:hypothetical protein